MRYYGIPNSPSKSKISRRTPSHTIIVDPIDLAWDCQRHIDFLYMMQEDAAPDRMMASLYADYLLKTGRTTEVVRKKCEEFWALFNTLKTTPKDVWAIVTEDGARLDGSHRAACAVVRGLAEVTVSVVPLYPFDQGFRKQCQRVKAQKEADDAP